MKKLSSKINLFVFSVSLCLSLAACNMPRRGATTTPSGAALYTAAAQTVAAQLVQATLFPATATQAEPPISLNTPTLFPTATEVPPTPTNTLIPPTATPLPCDRVKFIKDITYPDNSVVDPGATFTKTWRLQNVGACTWSPQYALVFVAGDPMGTPAAVPLPKYVASGETVDVSVTLTAPTAGGTYKGEYKLRNASNAIFGIGENNQSFYVQIKVPIQTGVVFDFLSKASSAEWKSGTGTTFETDITFNNADDDPNGTAKIKEGVTLENGSTSSKVLLTYPKRVNNGFIAGTYPAYTVQNGDHFRARIGFMLPSGSCAAGKVKFRLNAIVDGKLSTLQTWDKTCSGDLIAVDVNLSGLKGKAVQFMLAVLANGAPEEDWAIWSSPRIEHP
ncbi:MAG: NBR1-Ig-like domain-containing protein [Anaerolineales bacterium]